MRGLRTKIRDVFLSVLCDSFEAFALTETWLNDSFNSNEIFSSNYQVFRNDNKPELSNKSRGGGVLLAFSKGFQILRQPFFFNTSMTDAIFVLTSFQNVTILFGCTYICNDSPPAEYTKLYEFYRSVSDCLTPNVKCVICGDFNIPDYAIGCNNKSKKLLDIFNFTDANDFIQYNEILNKNGRLLDLVLSDVKDVCVTRSMSPLVSEDAHHPSLEINMFSSSSFTQRQKLDVKVTNSNKYNFKKGDFLKLYLALTETDFEDMYNCDEVNLACEIFYKQFYKAMDLSIPKQTSEFNPKFPTYFNKKLINLIKQKQNIYNKLRKNRKNTIVIKKYNNLRKRVKQEIRKVYAKYTEACENLIKKDPKKIWNFTAEKLGRKTSVPSSIRFDKEIIVNPQQIANKFAEQFQSMFTKDETLLDVVERLLKDSTANFNDFISSDEVVTAIKRLKSSSSCGPDLIPPYVLKGCSEHLVKPLCYLFNLCLKNSVYPSCWKTSRVCPIFKKGDRNDSSNYRAVGVLNCVSKCFEIILFERIYSYVKCSLNPAQHGFVKGRSTVSNLVHFTSSVAQHLHNKDEIDAIYFDFSLAFDKVNHSILLMKMVQNFEIPIYLISLIKSYLTDRMQFVSYNGITQSQAYQAYSGVVQGSNLGPLLFCIFINDLPEYIKNSSCLLFADDLKLYRIVNSQEDHDKLQADIDAVTEWACFNKMHLNKNKCEMLKFSNRVANRVTRKYIVDGVSLTISSCVKDLGVLVDNKLTFKNHVTNMIQVSSKILNFVIHRGYHFKNIDTLKLLYYCLVRSRLEYASNVWNPSNNFSIEIIEKIQKRFLRYIYYRHSGVYPHYKHHNIRTSDLLEMFNMVSLASRRDTTDVVYI